MRLGPETVDCLAPEVERPGYDRGAQAVGIVHLGIGAFHRAHQAWYTDRAMAGGDRNWAIAGVSLRSGQVADQLNPQDGLYTVTERGGDVTRTRLIGAVRGVIAAPNGGSAAAAWIAAPTTRIVSLTVTEKGYLRTADGSFDQARAGQHSIYSALAEGLRRRRAQGLPGVTLLSCDNLAENGRQLARLMTTYLDAHDPVVATWFAAECTCPSTMVDRIIPATTAADRAGLAARVGATDEAAVLTEPFSQWVIEDRFAGPRPGWHKVGADLVGDVRPYETAKLRMLNGAHSALAYIGLRRGHSFVHEAVADPEIRPLIEQLMRREAAPTVAAAPGQDLDAYADALIARFDNPSLRHRLAQIGADGSQKIPQRWLETLAENARMGRECPAILTGIAAWIDHLRGANGPVDDPRAAELRAAVGRNGDPVGALLGAASGLGSAWTPSAVAKATIEGYIM